MNMIIVLIDYDVSDVSRVDVNDDNSINDNLNKLVDNELSYIGIDYLPIESENYENIKRIPTLAG